MSTKSCTCHANDTLPPTSSVGLHLPLCTCNFFAPLDLVWQKSLVIDIDLIQAISSVNALVFHET